MGQVQVEADGAGAGHGVACYAWGAIVDDAVVIVVGAGRDVDGLARIEREAGAEGEEAGGLAGGEQVELVEAVVIGASPVGGGIVAVGGEVT